MKSIRIPFLLILLCFGLSNLVSEIPFLESDTDYEILAQFGPAQFDDGEWYLSKGIVIGTETGTSVICPVEASFTALVYENIETQPLLSEEDTNLIVIGLEDGSFLVFFNIDSSQLKEGQKIEARQEIGKTSGSSFQISLVEGDYRCFTIPNIFGEDRNLPETRLLDPVEFFLQDTHN